MVDKPILFSAPMIRALLDERKTQTRRVLKLPRKTFSGGAIYERPDMGGWEATISGGGGCFTINKAGERVPEPECVAVWHRTTGVCMATPIQPGDRLWVREAWAHDAPCPPQYRAGPHVADDALGVRWRPSIHMPRWASRLTLIVTDVRVQRLQEISEEDARAEGVPDILEGNTGDEIYCPRCQGNGVHGALGDRMGYIEVDCRECETARQRFRNLWNSINGPGAWDANPWIAAYTFTVHRCNIAARANTDPAP